MALNDTPSRETYYGNGVATSWATPFIFWDPTEIECTRVDMQGVEHPLEYKVDFDVTGGGGKTGNVLYPISGDPLPGDGTEQNSEWLIANRLLKLEQRTRLGSQGPYFARNVETELDKTNARIQQQQEQLDRSIKQALSGANGDLTFPPPLAEAIIGWDEAGAGLRNWIVEQLGTVAVTAFTREWLTSPDAPAGRSKLDAPGLGVDNPFTGAATIGNPVGGMLGSAIWNFEIAPRINNIPMTAGAIVQLGQYPAAAGEIRAEGAFPENVDFVIGVLTGFRMASAADDFGLQLLDGTAALGAAGYFGTSASHNGVSWTLNPVNASSVAQVTFGYNVQTANSASGFFFLPNPGNDVSADNANRVSMISLFSAVGSTPATPSYTTIAKARYTGTWTGERIDGIRIRAMTDSVGAGTLYLVGFKAS